MPTSLLTGIALLLLVGLIMLAVTIIVGIVQLKRTRISSRLLKIRIASFVGTALLLTIIASQLIGQPAHAMSIDAPNYAEAMQKATVAPTATNTPKPFITPTPYPSLTPTMSETPIVLYTQVFYVSTYTYGLTPTSCTVVAKTATYLRGDPSEKVAAIGTIFAGSLLNVTGRVANKQWWRVINTDGSSPVEGWVRSDYVTADASCTDQPVAVFGPTETPTRLPTGSVGSAVTPSPCTLLTTSAASLRADPSRQDIPLAQIPAGTVLMAANKFANGQWWRVTYGDQAGWIGGGAVLYLSQLRADAYGYADSVNSVNHVLANWTSP